MFKVTYSGGESRFHPGTGVDYMQVIVEDADGDEYRLYAEIDPADLCDAQGVPAILDGEFNPSCIDFDGYDSPDCPQHMMPGVLAESRID